MDMKGNAAYCRREFGFVDVEWIITNYYIQTCRENWVIPSPEFTVRGSDLTKWRLSLKSGDEEGKYVSWTCLERIDTDSFSNEVRVNWKLFYYCGRRLHSVTETTANFEKGSEFAVQICDMNAIELDMLYSTCNTFIVRCLMMVYRKDTRTFPRSKNMGIRSLSQDMTVLFRLTTNLELQDTGFKISVDGEEVPAHNALLSFRNDWIKFEVAYGKNLKLPPSLQLGASKNTFAYLYTGNLDYVLRTPSFALRDCIKHFGIEQLADHYTPDEITLRTKSEDRKYNFKWFIRDFKSEGDACIKSSIFGGQLTNWTFRLYFYTNGIHGNEDTSIFVEILDGDWPEYVYLEFGVSNIIHNYEYIRSLRVTEPKYSRNIGIENFISGDTLKKQGFVSDGTLMILFKVHVPVCCQSLSVLKSKTHCNISSETEPHYELLSNQISRLFETEKYSDFTIECGERSFKVHKFILKIRSHRLRNIICQVNGKKSISFSGIEPHILRLVLLYLYSGKLKDFQIGDVVKIYAVAERFVISPLKYTCSAILQENIGAHNFVEVMALAHESKDYKLQLSTFKYISKNLEMAAKEMVKYPVKLNNHLLGDLVNFLKNSNLNLKVVIEFARKNSILI